MAGLLDQSFYLLRRAPRGIFLSVALLLSLPAAATSILRRPLLPVDPALLDPALVAFLCVSTLVKLSTWTAAAAAVGWQVHEVTAGRPNSVWVGLVRCLRHLPQLFWTLLLLTLGLAATYAVVIVGGVALILVARFAGVTVGVSGTLVLLLAMSVPVAVAASCFVLFPHVVVLEERYGTRAVRRVWHLTAGARLRPALLLLALLVLSPLTLLVFGGLKLYSEPLGFAAAAFAGLLISSYILVAQSLLYLQLRADKEGYDLELLATAIESKGAA